MRIVSLFLAFVPLLSGCVPREDDAASREPTASGAEAASGTEVVRPTPGESSAVGSPVGTPSSAGSIRVVFLGTSLTEGLGLGRPAVEAWPARVDALADSAGLEVDVVNAGLSGETSAGALRRIEWVLRLAPDVLVVETGANDGLRALPVDEMERNLAAIVSVARASSPELDVVLVPMEAPPNLGPEYASRFREAYPRAARTSGATLAPFILDGVAGLAELNQADGIHPTSEGHDLMARNAWPLLDSVFRAASARREAGR